MNSQHHYDEICKHFGVCLNWGANQPVILVKPVRIDQHEVRPINEPTVEEMLAKRRDNQSHS